MLSDREIVRELKAGRLNITPFEPSSLNPAGYDLRSAYNLSINPGHHKLAATLERVALPKNLVGTLHLRSSLAREGLFASLALVDPGFRGQLTISLQNAGDANVISLRKGERFVQISFTRLGVQSARSYTGRYQESKGIVRSLRRRPK